jgi:cytidyltransferase-like protein
MITTAFERPLVLTSGGFDPLHVGHIRLIQAAAELGSLLVVVNCDAWLERKKGRAFMPASQRVELVRALKGVDQAVVWSSRSSDVAGAIRHYQPQIFAKGGDRGPGSLPGAELEACAAVGCRIVYGVGGPKIQSSSLLLAGIK